MSKIKYFILFIILASNITTDLKLKENFLFIIPRRMDYIFDFNII